MYELSSGNNWVRSLAWDAPRATLYAATECFYVDRLGYHHDYRPAKINNGKPDSTKTMELPDTEDEDDDFGDEDEDEYDPEGKCWLSGARHDESSFGVAHDAGSPPL